MGQEALASLVATSELKMDRLEALNAEAMVFIRYDDAFDAFFLMLVPPASVAAVVHYVDGDLALLYDPLTREVVGFQVENFAYRFLKEHEQLRNLWDSTFGQGSAREALRHKGEIVREVSKASSETLEEHGVGGMPQYLQEDISEFNVALV